VEADRAGGSEDEEQHVVVEVLAQHVISKGETAAPAEEVARLVAKLDQASVHIADRAE
jgi:hypothetical protein